jgi:hypothetical protein
MNDRSKTVVRILRYDAATLVKSKDEEYAYWQSRPPLERLLTMQELSFAFFEELGDEARTRQQFLRSPDSLPRLPR